MDYIDGHLKLSVSTKEELARLNDIFEDESAFFVSIEGESGPSPQSCFSGAYLPPGKTKEDFKMISCYEDDDIIGWATILKNYPEDGIYYITHFSLMETVRYNGYG